jgi:hypothetical protein
MILTERRFYFYLTYMYRVKELAETQSSSTLLRPGNIRPRGASEPFDLIGIAHTNQFAAVRLTSRTREGLAKDGKPIDPGSGSMWPSGHATDVLVSEIARRPCISATSSRGKRNKDVELAGTRDFRSRIGREVEVKAASLPFSLEWEVKGEEGGHVRLAAVLEDFAFGLVAAHSTSPNVVLGGDAGPDRGILGVGRRSLCAIGLRTITDRLRA